MVAKKQMRWGGSEAARQAGAIRTSPLDEELFPRARDLGPNARILAAALEPANLFGVGAMVVLASLLWSPVPLMIGAGAEMLYLLFLPDSAFYRRWTMIRAGEEDMERRRATRDCQLRQLPEALAPRFARLASLEARLQERARELPEEAGGWMGEAVEKLDPLLERAFRLFGDLTLHREYLAGVDLAGLEEELRRLRERLARQEAGLATRELLEQNCEVLERRRERLRAIQEAVEQVEAQIGVLEDALALMLDQAMALTPHAPQELSRELDALLGRVAATEAALAETRSLVRARPPHSSAAHPAHRRSSLDA